MFTTETTMIHDFTIPAILLLVSANVVQYYRHQRNHFLHREALAQLEWLSIYKDNTLEDEQGNGVALEITKFPNAIDLCLKRKDEPTATVVIDFFDNQVTLLTYMDDKDEPVHNIKLQNYGA